MQQKPIEKIPTIFRMNPTSSYLVDKINEIIEVLNRYLDEAQKKGTI